MNLKSYIAVRGVFTLALVATAATVFTLWLPEGKPKMQAISLLPPAKKLGTQGELSPDKIAGLLSESPLQPVSTSEGSVGEPDLPSGVSLPPDVDILGYGQSQFLLDTRWATIRYVGDTPAGAGYTGSELNRRQKEALGTVHDSIPVITAAQTIHEMMEQYFAPMLKSLPRGDDILSRIKVQGAYFSPRSRYITETDSERDNAFIVGVQSLYIYPNSCFDKANSVACSPVGYSAGHDPTIIGHELAHVIFNHMRDERSLEGWQWFAVNEGYADYFSASYFGDPVLGRIWRVSRPGGARYLRRLLDTPTTNDPKALEEGHAFGSVWSSALWRSRNRIVTNFKVTTSEFDRVILMSINFLGESTKTKLGDAAASVLKAAEILGHSDWKATLIEEFAKGEVELARGVKISAAKGEVIEAEQGGFRCGQIAAHGNGRSERTALPSAAYFLLFAPLLAIVTRFKRPTKGNWISLLVIFFLPMLQGCQLSSLWKTSESQPSGLAIIYQCNLNALRDGTPLLPAQRTLTLTFAENAPADVRSEQIFVGDERFENADSALLLIVDKGSLRIDQFRKRDGSLFQLYLGQKYLNSEDALAVQNMRLASIIIEGAARAWKNESTQKKPSASSTPRNAVSFDITGSPATATISPEITGARGFGPLASEVNLNGTALCTYQKTTR
jgi:hypothetical protein